MNLPIDNQKELVEIGEILKGDLTSSFKTPTVVEIPADKKINKFDEFFEKNNSIYFLTQKNNLVIAKLFANFKITEIKEITTKFNDNSEFPDEKYYSVSLKNSSNIAETFDFCKNSKTDARKFQEVLNQKTGFIISAPDDIFKSFINFYFAKEKLTQIVEYINAGQIGDKKILFANSLVEDGCVFMANKNGEIARDNHSVRLAKSQKNMPILSNSARSVEEIANDLIENHRECFGEFYFKSLLALGFGVMSKFFEPFARQIGVPTLILSGATSTGKTTLQTAILALNGLKKSSMSAGGSTVKAVEYNCRAYNGIPICNDDTKTDVLNSNQFNSYLKSAYNAVSRQRMSSYGKEVEFIRVNSPSIYSTNGRIPDLKELINRVVKFEFINSDFKPDFYHYHENQIENLNELSKIQIELSKYSFDDVKKIYDENFLNLEALLKEKNTRIINNYVFCYVGVILLFKMANKSVDDLFYDLFKLVENEIKNYKNSNNIFEKFIDNFMTLVASDVLKAKIHFKVEHIYPEKTFLRFRKKTLLAHMNKFFMQDKNNLIDEEELKIALSSSNRLTKKMFQRD